MEARIKSARKASEIHKKRTGKALRITPEDVRNEKMYQEINWAGGKSQIGTISS